jgi:hypothetical protein
MNERDELLAKAEELGLTFAKNIPTLKLEELVISAMEASTALPEVDENELEDNSPQEFEAVSPMKSRRLSELEERKRAIEAGRKRAYATRVVTLTNRDNRENDFMTTAYLSFENQYFSISKLVPLDVPVELEQGLIDVAEGSVITLHKDEIIDGKRTGNKVPTSVKKFAISYNDSSAQ